MRKKSHVEKIKAFHRNETKRITFNALRGRASPYSLEEAQEIFTPITERLEKISLFKEKIGKLFPLILDLVAHGAGIREVERQIGLHPRSLEEFLNRHPKLMMKVREARGLRGVVDGTGVDGDTP